MRRMLWISAAAALVFPAAAVCAQEQQQSQSQQSQTQSQSDSQKAQPSSTDKSRSQNSQSQAASQSAQPQDSLAAAAKKAREQKRDSAKPAKVFTNDDMPAGGISTVGADKSGDSAAGARDADAAAGANDEKTWRTRFEKLRHKLDQDQQELDILQRELGVAATQFYGGDPNKAMNDQMSGQPNGAEYTKKLGDIDAKKKQVEADKQAISDAEDELRKAGGDPGWAR